jgi:Ca2+-binding RTX toxin-like protein
VRIGDIGEPISDFASLPQATVALNVTVEKDADADSVNAGGTVNYQVTIENNGITDPRTNDISPGTIPDIQVSDPLPDGIESFSWTRQILNADGDVVGSTSGSGPISDTFDLEANQRAVYQVAATVSSLPSGDAIQNTARVRVPGFGIVDPNNPDRLLPEVTATDSIEIGNQPPEVDDGLVTTPPGEVTAVDVLFGSDDGTIERYVIDTIPEGGVLRVNGREIGPGDSISADELDQLVFDANDNFDGSSFTYRAIDNQGEASEPGEITLNSPPQVTGGEEDVPPGAVTNLSDDLFSGEDPDGTINRYEITELPPASQGTLFIGDPERGGREVAEGETLTPDQLDRLFFRAEPGFSGTTFGFRAIDNQGAESPTAEVTLGTANAPPDTEDVLQVIEPGEPVTLNGLGGTDIESDEGDLTYQIDELPGEGTLTLDGEEISAGAVLTPDELARLQFSFPEGFTGNTSFTYVAIDETGAEDPTPGTVFLKTEGSNIPPETEETTVEVPPNTFGGANEIPRGVATRLTGLGGNDPDGEIDEFRITRAPGNGTLFLGDPADGGRALGTDDTIPANRIDDVFFLPDDNFNGSDFAYTAIDNESEEDPTPAEVTLEVGNRFPDTDNVTNPVPEPGEVIRLSGLGGSDEDGNISGFVINTLPNRGTLFLGRPGAGGVAVEEGQILTPDELSRLFLDVGDGSGDIRFTYSAIDNLGAIDPIPGEVRFTNQTTSPDDEEEEDDDDPVPDIGGDPSPSPTPSADPDPDPEPDPDFDSLCPPKPEKPEIPQLAELPEVNRQMPDPLPALQVDGLEQLDSVEVLDSTAGNLVVGGSGDDEIRGSLGDDQLRGSQGNDRIVTGGGNNALAGNQGDDTLLGHQGDDTLNGGQDRDLILGRGGNNVIWGDRGDDTISGGPGNDIIGGGPQNRTPEFEGSDDLIYGDGGNDTIFGNLGQTSLSGGEGDDMIFGGRGDDQVHGDAGSDTLKGEFGNDTLIGSPDTIEPARDAANEAITDEDIANEDLLTDAEAFTPPELTFEFLAGLEDPREATEDPESSPEPTPEPTPEPSPDPTPEPSPDPVSTGDLLSGNDGDDVLFGGAGSDSLFGGDDNDWLDGGSADDLLFGDRGADTLYGNQGNNTLVGGSLNPDRIDEDGPDLLYGGIGNDLILGNRGDDTISTGNGNNLAFGGQNNDLIYGGQGSDTLKGEFGDDTLLGSPRSLSAEAAVSNLLSGNKGNDVILAGHGGDRVYGGDGEDLIFGGDGTDLMFGDRGDDTIHGGEGNDTLVAANGNPLVRENDGNNLIFAGEGEDLVLGGSGNDSLIGNDGNDTVRGGRGNDMVWGDSGDDLLFGDHGNDTLCGGSGNDTLVAGNGNPNDPATGDNLLIGAAGNNVMFGNGGQDTFQGGLGNDTIYGGSGDVIVFGERGNNVIFGQRGNDTLAGGNDSSLVHGGQGNDVLFGNAGNNTLYGGQDDDTLYSGRGNSRLFGDEGDDLLFGQRGNDTLIGGGGQNGFAISNEAENNLILDFDLTQDAFVLFDGITREDLTFDSRDGQTLLQRNGQTIAILVDVGLEQVNEITFR